MSSAPASPPRRLLVVTTHLEMLRGHYHGVLIRLANAGVELSIRYAKEKWLSEEDYRALFRAAGAEADIAPLPPPTNEPNEVLALRLRELQNVLRYAHPDYAGRQTMGRRALYAADPGVRRWARLLTALGTQPALAAARLARRLEGTLPPSRSATELLDQARPDAVAVVRLTGEPEFAEYVKAATSRSAPTAVWIVSWDNLTNKGLLHGTPDRVFVWNESLAAELARYHSVAPETVRMTGAQNFDHWFNGATPSDRNEYCARIGIDPERPIILYLGSSLQIAPYEPDFFERWLARVRASADPVLREANVVVRPHPLVVDRWLGRGFGREPGVAVMPSTSRDPLNSDAFRQEYRDELHHASIAVGLNTTGLIDSAIFGKPVCTVELPQLYDSQRGTVHFDHLVDGPSSLLRSASNFDDHVRELATLVGRDPYAQDERSLAFVRAFVRPNGLAVEPAAVFTREMLALFRERSLMSRPTALGRLLGAVVARLALPLGAPLEARPLRYVVVHLAGGWTVRRVLWRHRLRALAGRRSPQRAGQSSS